MTDFKPTKEAAEKLAREGLAIRAGIASVTLAWAQIENALVMMLTAILKLHNYRIPAAIYFTLTSLESRMNIVDAAFRELLEGRLLKEEILILWHATFCTLSRLKVTRNKIAHGQIMHQARTKKIHMRLTAPMMKYMAHTNLDDGAQLHGLSANDLEHSAKAAREIASDLERFEAIAFLAHQETDAALATLRERLRELEVARQSRRIQAGQIR